MNENAQQAFLHRRGRPASGNFELYSWLFMRVSGVILLFVAVFHLFYMHFIITVDAIDFDLIAERLRNPLWKLYDFFLLFFSLTHGVNGFRYVLDDYLRHPGWTIFVKSVVSILYFAFLAMGTYIILTFSPQTVLTAQP